MKSYLPLCLIASLLLGFRVYSSAQPLIRTYSVMDGLTSNTVWSITQDQQGFMWFGTKNGINRFDGYNFKAYQFNKKRPGSLGNNFINVIVPVGPKSLWVGTQGGVYIFDQEKENFRFLEEIGRKGIYDILKDRKQNIWIATRSAGLYRYAAGTGRLTNYKAGSLRNPISSNHIRKLAEDKHGRIWLATFGKGIDVLDAEGKLLNNHSSKNSQLFSDQLLTMYCDRTGDIWAGTFGGGLTRFDTKLNRSENFKKEDGINDNIVRSICEPTPGKIYVGTEKGVNILNLADRRISSVVRKASDPLSLSDNAIYSIYPDREGGVWIGTFFGGVNYLKEKSSGFEHYHSTAEPSTLNGNAVSSFLEDKPGMFWVGTEDGGLNYFNSYTKTFQRYPFHSGQEKLSYNNIHALFKDRQDRIWIGTFAGGLNIYDPRNGSVTTYRNSLSNEFTISSDNVYSIYEDREQTIWVGTTNGINKYDAKNNRFIRIKNPELDENIIYDIYEDHTATMWFATHDNGLIWWNKPSGKWGKYQSNSKNSLSSDKITCILDDHAGNLWIGTDGGGLNRFNFKRKSFDVFEEGSGMEANVIYGLVQDNNKQLWISTNNGIYHFIPGQNSFRFYSTWDNLQSRQFNYKAAYKSSSGKIFFGGIKGFNAFYPDSIRNYEPVQKIVITNFMLFNREPVVGQKDSPLDTTINYSKEIELSYDQSVISFEYVAMSYLAPNKAKYAYKMEGFDKDWNYVGTLRKATYTNLPPGHYVFSVKTSGNDGSWGQEASKITVIVRPPLYRTAVAYLIYLFLLILGFVLVRRYLLAQARKKNLIRLERVRSRKEKEFYAQKIEFFTAMAHEIRTPLSLIIAPLEKLLGSKNLKAPDEQKQLSVMEENANRLLTLVNQLLDFRRIESEFYKIKKENVELLTLIHNIYSRFSAIPYQNNVEFSMATKVNNLMVQVDPEAFTKILSNLLSNAFKFTRTKVKIFIDKPESTPDGKHFFSISVEDDGIGIPGSELENIFSKFFKITSGHHNYSNLGGTGIGLALAKALIEKHDGKLEVFSTEHVNTIFKLSIPYVTYHELSLPEQDTQDGGDEKFQILVSEDDLSLNEFICTGLKSEGYRVFSSSNGDEALRCIEEQRIDLILSDIMMPVMDGMELVTHIKSDINFSHIPIILLTARSNSESEISAIEEGADAYIVKPFKWKHLAAVIKNLLDSRAMMHEKFSRQPFALAHSLTTNNRDQKFMEKVLEIIEKRITDPQLSVEQLSRELTMSRSSLHKKLKTLSGHVPNQFIRLIRLKKAASLILINEYTISEISHLVGFNSHSYFSRCFIQQFKLSPTEFLEKHREEALN